jgi:NFU1 iron-sulfur cluster scaffold homolog, mitochondrial
VSEPQEIKISAIPSVNPRICRFDTSTPLLPFGKLHFRKENQTNSPALITALFSIEGITEVAVRENSLLVSTTSASSWQKIGKQVGQAIRDNLTKSFEEFEHASRVSQESAEPSSETSQRIQKILDEKINPSVAKHGGRIQFMEYKEGRVYITMEGGCQGCSMSKVTLKSGVERTLREEIPDLLEVVDVTDHHSGEKPFYAHS